MSTLGTLKTRLDKELADSEIINKSSTQREEAINDSCQRIYEYRNWPELYLNTTTQSVDKIINIPRNMDSRKTTALWFGKNVDYYFHGNNLSFVNQTDFFTDIGLTATVTEDQDIQVIRISEENRGFDANNTSVNSTIGINDAAARGQVGQTFDSTTTSIEGVALKLSTVGSPTGTLTVSITETSASLPTTSLGSVTYNINEITSTEEWHWIKFSSAITVTSGTTYAITVNPSYSESATDYVAWSYHTTSQVDGTQVLNNGSTWSAGTGDNGFAVCTDYYNFQYVKKFVTMSDSTDDSGLGSDFDQAIVKLAAGMILENKGFANDAAIKWYGVGNMRNPSDISAYGILNQLWTNKRRYGARQMKKVRTIYEKARHANRETWPYSGLTNLI